MTLDELKLKLEENNIPCNDEQLKLLKDYMDYILTINQEVNLTAITNEEDFISKMIFDSALPLRLTDFNNKKVLDIGTGAGYPGTVIDILTNADVTLLDSTRKKLDVISYFPNRKFKVVCARAEEYIKEHREEYDIVIARAVADLKILLELAVPFVKVGGYFIAMKGRDYLGELYESTITSTKLKVKYIKSDRVKLEQGEIRGNILFQKREATDKKYPRAYSQIIKKPL